MSVIWPDGRCMSPCDEMSRRNAVYPFCTRPRGHRGAHTSVNPYFAIPSDVADAEATLRPVTRWSAS